MKKKQPKAIILGAGVAGLASGWKLSEVGYQILVLEKNPFIGGMASSFRYKDFTLDHGPHKIFTLMEDVLKEVTNLVGKDNLLVVKKKSRIYMNGRFLNYPVTLGELLKKLGLTTCMVCGLSFLKGQIKSLIRKPVDHSFEDWVINRFGFKISNLIFSPYARKIWGEPKNLAVELASTRIAAPSLWEIVRQMILKLPSNSVINADYFYYPKYGVWEIPKKMAERIQKKKGKILTNETITNIKVDNGKVTTIDYGERKKVIIGEDDVIVSTIPIPILLRIIYPPPPKEVFLAAQKLKTRNLILFYLIINKQSVSDDSWLFFPESKFIFNRIFEQKNFSSYLIPKEKTTLCIEVTCDADSSTWRKSTDEIYKTIIDQLEHTGLVNRDEVIEYFDKRLSFAYPIYDINFRDNLDKIYKFVDTIKNIYTIGRQGAFGYTGTLDSIDMGFTVASFIQKHQARREWSKAREKFTSYVVVD